MVISKYKRELNGDISEILLNTGEVMQNTEYLTDLEEKTVTENGTYTPSTGKVGFSKVVVNVESGGGSSDKVLYCWYDSVQVQYVYTLTEDLTTDDKFIINGGEYGSVVYPQDITEVGEGYFISNEQTFNRHSEGDVYMYGNS